MVTTDTPNLRTIKVCPSCKSSEIYHRRKLLGYFCLACKASFFVPFTKQVVDHRNGLKIPKCLLAYVKT